jgi:hypothetical protein
MQFHLGAVPESQDFTPDSPWKPLREPGPILMQCFALPLGIVACGAVVGLWLLLTPVAKNPVASPILLALGILAIFPVHEMLHALVHPRWGMSRDSILGLWPSRLLFYAHYTGELSRNRFVAVLGMPLLVISTVPLAVCALIGHAPATVAFLSAFNAVAAGGDICGMCVVLLQVPSAATVRNQGWRTYWRPLKQASANEPGNVETTIPGP